MLIASQKPSVKHTPSTWLWGSAKRDANWLIHSWPGVLTTAGNPDAQPKKVFFQQLCFFFTSQLAYPVRSNKQNCDYTDTSNVWRTLTSETDSWLACQVRSYTQQPSPVQSLYLSQSIAVHRSQLSPKETLDQSWPVKWEAKVRYLVEHSTILYCGSCVPHLLGSYHLATG